MDSALAVGDVTDTSRAIYFTSLTANKIDNGTTTFIFSGVNSGSANFSSTSGGSFSGTFEFFEQPLFQYFSNPQTCLIDFGNPVSTIPGGKHVLLLDNQNAKIYRESDSSGGTVSSGDVFIDMDDSVHVAGYSISSPIHNLFLKFNFLTATKGVVEYSYDNSGIVT